MDDVPRLRLAVDEKTTLRLLRPEDAEPFFSNVERMRETLSQWFPWVEPLQDAKSYAQFIKHELEKFEAKEGFAFGIWHQQELAGAILVPVIESGTAELAYLLDEQFQRRGLITQGCKAVIKYLFEQSDISVHRIEIYCGQGNAKSNGVPERLSFTLEGVREEAFTLPDGRHVNANTWRLLRPEWEQKLSNSRNGHKVLASAD